MVSEKIEKGKVVNSRRIRGVGLKEGSERIKSGGNLALGKG